MLVGVVLLYLGWSGAVAGTPGTIIKWLGFLPLLTGLSGWCPAYTLFRFKTKKA